MKPGPELDALIAEKVMGWKKIELNPPVNGLKWMWDKREGCLYYEAQTVPPYSTRINNAWEVWEWLEKNHKWTYGEYGTKADILLTRHKGKSVVAIMNDYWDSGICDDITDSSVKFKYPCNPYIVGETYEHAICLAVLRAVGD